MEKALVPPSCFLGWSFIGDCGIFILFEKTRKKQAMFLRVFIWWAKPQRRKSCAEWPFNPSLPGLNTHLWVVYEKSALGILKDRQMFSSTVTIADGEETLIANLGSCYLEFDVLKSSDTTLRKSQISMHRMLWQPYPKILQGNSRPDVMDLFSAQNQEQDSSEILSVSVGVSVLGITCSAWVAEWGLYFMLFQLKVVIKHDVSPL